MKNKKGFIFVETIIVTCVLLMSLMVTYSLYVSSVNQESRKLRYDDPAKLYQTYYIRKYLDGFDLSILKENIKTGVSKYELIHRSRSDIFGSSYSLESSFFEDLWMKLNIKNIYFFPNNVSEIAKCDTYILDGKTVRDAICTNTNLITYLKNIDNGPDNTFMLVIEYAMKKDGTPCSNVECFHYYSNSLVGD